MAKEILASVSLVQLVLSPTFVFQYKLLKVCILCADISDFFSDTMYFVPLWMAIASTVFQYHGTHEGTLIDPHTNELLVKNEAFLYVANLLKELVRYSMPALCVGCNGGPKVAFSKGRCAMLVDLPGNACSFLFSSRQSVPHTNTNTFTPCP